MTVTDLHFALFLFLFFFLPSSYPERHLQDHGGLWVVHIAELSLEKNLYARVGQLGPHCKKWRAVGTSTRAVARPQKPPHRLWRCCVLRLGEIALMATSTPRSTCWKFVPIVTVSVATLILLRLDERRMVALCNPMRQLTGSRRDQKTCHPSTSAQYQSSRRSQVR